MKYIRSYVYKNTRAKNKDARHSQKAGVKTVNSKVFLKPGKNHLLKHSTGNNVSTCQLLEQNTPYLLNKHIIYKLYFAEEEHV